MSLLSTEKLLQRIRSILPDFDVIDHPKLLNGGLINCVWRIRGKNSSIVAKYAPPFVATAPEIPLDPKRLGVEAQALKTLGPAGKLSFLCSESLRTPQFLAFDASLPLLLMEDLGDGLDLRTWLLSSKDLETSTTPISAGQSLGTFIGRLHKCTYNKEEFRADFDNIQMQEARLRFQYETIAANANAWNLKNADLVGQRCQDLGEEFLKPGSCVVMGDLWPSSLLLRSEGLRLIDWELAHFGRPCQDIAHLLAHLWMLAHQALSKAIEDRIHAFRIAFINAYLLEAKQMLSKEERLNASTHFGAEILARTLGNFRHNSDYAQDCSSSAKLKEAVSVAVNSVTKPNQCILANWLNN